MAKSDMHYLRMDVRKRPKSKPGMVLGHNHVLHNQTTPLGWNGFRAFMFIRTELPDFVVCSCGWRPELGEHYALKKHAELYNTPRKRAYRYRKYLELAPQTPR